MTYEKIIQQLESIQDNLMDIEDYNEEAYRAIQKAINYIYFNLLDE
ncbi:hypothetical protein [Enterococcus diestrammenae]|uniref:Uncharacterized protein n=1 Tax=Enterococcus diestrammenae TaxID=1155073 RepID=A0ABV0F859_9ENTE|nr:hypothetical protein [Enterococcus diestrammenae]